MTVNQNKRTTVYIYISKINFKKIETVTMHIKGALCPISNGNIL